MLEPEEETRVAGRNVPDYVPPLGRRDPVGETAADLEEQIFSVSPTLLFVKIGYAAAVIGGILLVALLTFIPYVPAWAAVLLGLLLLLIPGYYHLRKKLIRYKLTDTTVEIDSGLISRSTRNIPLRRIQDVTVSANAWQRLLGFGDVVIDNASDDGGRVVLQNINSPRHYADMLLRQMRLLDK
jgi:uncharacterized membrane protein YdbT with pleckstrin-like domain